MKPPKDKVLLALDPRELLKDAENTTIFQDVAEEVQEDAFKNGFDPDIKQKQADWAFLKNKTPGFEFEESFNKKKV